MESKVSLSRSQEPATGSYPGPYVSSDTFLPYFLKIHSNIIFQSTPRSSERSLSFRFSDQK